MAIPGLEVRPRSVVTSDGAVCSLADTPAGTRLLVRAPSSTDAAFGAFDGDPFESDGLRGLSCALTPGNAAALRARFDWLRPRSLGLKTSVGLGDRLGVATPGHVRALRAVGGTLAPVLAQQSVRENARTGRTPAQVVDDAMWGAFEEGWRNGFGADADHLKSTADIDAFVAAGYSFFTVDPGAFVNGEAERLPPAGLRASLASLPWDALEDSEQALWSRFSSREVDVARRTIHFDDTALARAAVKYGAAVAEVVRLYRHLAAACGGAFDFEVSVDETASATSPLEHYYIARELGRLGVRWTSLAPRFPGAFEKGIDYKGSLDQFRTEFAVHAAIALELGPYKLSLHSGSDKFRIYGIAAELTGGLVHLKTAGTSYLEALRTIASTSPDLFREIHGFALERYETDRATYHVSASLAGARRFADVPDGDLPAALESVDARQVLHVTYGSVLNERDGQGRLRFADRLFAALRASREAYATGLEAHFVRHMAPFAVSAGETGRLP